MFLGTKNYTLIFTILIITLCLSIAALFFYSISVKIEINDLKKSISEASEPVDRIISFTNKSSNIQYNKLKLDNEKLIAKVENLNNELEQYNLFLGQSAGSLFLAPNRGGGGGYNNCDKYIEENIELKINIKQLKKEIELLHKIDSLKLNK